MADDRREILETPLDVSPETLIAGEEDAQEQQAFHLAVANGVVLELKKDKQGRVQKRKTRILDGRTVIQYPLAGRTLIFPAPRTTSPAVTRDSGRKTSRDAALRPSTETTSPPSNSSIKSTAETVEPMLGNVIDQEELLNPKIVQAAAMAASESIEAGTMDFDGFVREAVERLGEKTVRKIDRYLEKAWDVASEMFEGVGQVGSVTEVLGHGDTIQDRVSEDGGGVHSSGVEALETERDIADEEGG